ncbi:type IV pili methyl-accepting chemotaxis transducer N-terminal domain-containing protein [Octadecabacter sp. CECT 8868]|uniref:type IV pili methyl-accepting chemotaxis transducer N-terminal domain-containing protein n=1 Tax=Octadecabacter algicola TaxID=2909342 RepID=UPI001F2F08E8|nr:type IV pili methyl-accepting chemotaxis transducer N-terminal domain-containing protein [Octadecabacter algicola]MCF2903984.1 type IV pili methyl-accepting chemotaxis transducer N-terminal domain-containing protein [Octadecabacter algicola]
MTRNPMTCTRRQFGLGAAAIGALSTSSSMTYAQDADFAGVVLRVGLAEEQAVLTQRIPMCANFIKLNVEPSRFMVNIEDAAKRFGQVLTGLRNGDADLGIVAETNGEVLEALSAVDAVWPSMQAAVETVIAQGFVEEAEFDAIARASSALLFMSENVEKRLLSVYGDSTEKLGILISVELAARQEMLTQKMAKEVGNIALGFKPEENRAILAGTIDLYENSLQALIGGVPALTLPPPPEHIELALLEEKSRWSDLGPIVRGIADGAEPGPLELYSIASQEESLLEAAQHIEHMYVELGSQG